MPTEKEPGDKASTPRRTEEDLEFVSLVDYLDSVDRAAFRRALELRNTYYPLTREN